MIALTEPTRLIKTTLSMFLIWGLVLLIFGDVVASVTSFAFIVDKLSYFNTHLTGLILIFNSIGLILSYKYKKVPMIFSFFTLQQLLLGLGLFGVCFSIFQGAYLDGVVVSRLHIFADQLLYLILGFIHLQEYYRYVVAFFKYDNFYEINKQKRISN